MLSNPTSILYTLTDRNQDWWFQNKRECNAALLVSNRDQHIGLSQRNKGLHHDLGGPLQSWSRSACDSLIAPVPVDLGIGSFVAISPFPFDCFWGDHCDSHGGIQILCTSPHNPLDVKPIHASDLRPCHWDGGGSWLEPGDPLATLLMKSHFCLTLKVHWRYFARCGVSAWLWTFALHTSSSFEMWTWTGMRIELTSRRVRVRPDTRMSKAALLVAKDENDVAAELMIDVSWGHWSHLFKWKLKISSTRKRRKVAQNKLAKWQLLPLVKSSHVGKPQDTFFDRVYSWNNLDG